MALVVAIAIAAAPALAPAATAPAALVAPARPAVPPPRADAPSLGAPLGEWAFSVMPALDIPPSGLDAGPRLTLEGMYGASEVSPTLRVGVGVRGSFAYHRFSGGGGSQWLVEGVPDVKLRVAGSEKVGLFADFGVGLAFFRTASEGSGADNMLTAAVQLGGGVSYALSPRVNLVGEFRFDVYTKGGGSSTFIALPTVGFEFR